MRAGRCWSPSVTPTQATLGSVVPAAHWASSTDLPEPAGATTIVSRRVVASSSCWTSLVRATAKWGAVGARSTSTDQRGGVGALRAVRAPSPSIDLRHAPQSATRRRVVAREVALCGERVTVHGGHNSRPAVGIAEVPSAAPTDPPAISGDAMGDSGPPVMLLVTSDDESRPILDGELRRRYAADYEVVTTGSYEHARAILEGLRHWQRDVAMVLACYSPADRDGLTFLRRARDLHPSAKRAVVVTWGEFDSAAAVFRAIAEGHAEVQLIRPERPRDEEFHGSITDVLDDWHLSQRHGLRGGAHHRPHRRAHPPPPRRLQPQPHPDRLLPRRLRGRPADAGRPRPGGPRAARARARSSRRRPPRS